MAVSVLYKNGIVDQDIVKADTLINQEHRHHNSAGVLKYKTFVDRYDNLHIQSADGVNLLSFDTDNNLLSSTVGDNITNLGAQVDRYTYTSGTTANNTTTPVVQVTTVANSMNILYGFVQTESSYITFNCTVHNSAGTCTIRGWTQHKHYYQDDESVSFSISSNRIVVSLTNRNSPSNYKVGHVLRPVSTT